MPPRQLIAVRRCLLAVLAALVTAVGLVGPASAVPSDTAVPAAPSNTAPVGGPRLADPGVVLDAPSGVPAPPKVPAAAWLVADLDTGKVLAAQGAHEPYAPASVLKILTAFTLLPRLDPKKTYTAQPADAAIDGSKVGLVPGSRYTVNDLFHGLMLPSGNDAANALANVAGGMPTTVDLMREQAKVLGARDTVVMNDSGLDAPGQVTSVYDLALMARAALRLPAFSSLVTTRTYSFPGGGADFSPARPHYDIQDHDRLLHNYPGALGVKNGYTVAARGSFVGAAHRDGHTYLAAALRVEGPSWHPVRDLLDWAFTNGTKVTPVGTLVPPGAQGDDGQLGAASAISGSGIPKQAQTTSKAQALPFGTAALQALAAALPVPGWAVPTVAVLLVLTLAVVALRVRAVRRQRRRRRRRA